MANIVNFKNEAGAVYKDESVTLNVQQNFGKGTPVMDEAAKGDCSGNQVLIKRARISKIDLFRLAIALHEYGAFEAADGDDLPQWKVVQAFGQMLGEDFSGYTNNVGGGTTTENPEIFDKLKRAFKKYEDRKLEDKEARR